MLRYPLWGIMNNDNTKTIFAMQSQTSHLSRDNPRYLTLDNSAKEYLVNSFKKSKRQTIPEDFNNEQRTTNILNYMSGEKKISME